MGEKTRRQQKNPAPYWKNMYYVSNSNKYSQLFLLKNFTAMSTHIQAQFELVVVCECESSVTWASRLVVDHLAMHVF